MSDALYTLTLTNEQRIALRRLLRENVQALQSAIACAVVRDDIDSAKRIAEEMVVQQALLDSVRALQGQA